MSTRRVILLFSAALLVAGCKDSREAGAPPPEELTPNPGSEGPGSLPAPQAAARPAKAVPPAPDAGGEEDAGPPETEGVPVAASESAADPGEPVEAPPKGPGESVLPLFGRPGFGVNPYTGKPIDMRGLAAGTVIRDPEDPGRTFRVSREIAFSYQQASSKRRRELPPGPRPKVRDEDDD